MKSENTPSAFTRFALWTAEATGKPSVFIGAVLVVILWALTGPMLHYSDTWQLTINTGTTIVTFLMVFLIQNTQNRDAKAMQLKLNELIRATEGAHNALVSAEDLGDEELKRYVELYNKFAEEVRRRSSGRQDGTVGFEGDDDTAIVSLNPEEVEKPLSK